MRHIDHIAKQRKNYVSSVKNYVSHVLNKKAHANELDRIKQDKKQICTTPIRNNPVDPVQKKTHDKNQPLSSLRTLSKTFS